MKQSPLLALGALGQSIWLDYIRRDLLTSGALARLMADDGLLGLTSNPAIFAKALAGGPEYRDEVDRLRRAGCSALDIYEMLSQEDVRTAADLFRPVHEWTEGRDGFVSLEVNPHLAHDTEGTLAEARRLWAALDRPNVLIKVPATAAGLPAIRQLIAEGINVNATLLFDRVRYGQVVEAFLAGLEARLAAGLPLQRVASVASFFVSRLDAYVDPRLLPLIAEGGQRAETAEGVRGRVAVASGRLAYQDFKVQFDAPRFRRLAAAGARVQRLLWASTGTKNPAFNDVKYVDALIGPDTVNTVPLETLRAYRDHGQPAARLESRTDRAARVMAQLPELGIMVDAMAQHLEAEGVQKFCQPFDHLLAALAAPAASLQEVAP